MHLKNWQFLRTITLCFLLIPDYQPAIGANLAQENFFIDARDRRIPLHSPPDKGTTVCHPLLDNAEDFSIDVVHTDFLIVKAVGQRPATGLLILSCDSDTYYVNLEFQPKHEFSRGAPQNLPTFVRPLSYWDIETQYNFSEKIIGANYGLTDQSSNVVKVSLARQIPDLSFRDRHTSTVDLEKPLGDHTVSASLAESRFATVSRTQALSHQYKGYALLLSNTQYERVGAAKSLNLSLPDPWSYQYKFSTSKQGERRHQMQRPTYYANAHLFNRFTPLYRYEILDQVYEKQELSVKNSTLFFNSPAFIPEFNLGGICADTCKMDLLGITTSAFWRNTSLVSSIDPIPGAIEAKGLIEFVQNISAGVEYRRTTGNKFLSTTERVIVSESGRAEISANSRYEHIAGTGRIFAEIKQNFVPIFFEGTSFSTGYMAREGPLDYSVKAEVFQAAVAPKPVFLASLRYYFEKNIRHLEHYSRSHSISGQVIERYTGKPIPEVEVSLIHESSVLDVVTSDDKGLFRFKDTIKSGDLLIVARKGPIAQEIAITKKLESPDPSHDITLDVYSAVNLKFFEDSDENGIYNTGDLQINLKNFDPLFNLGIIGAENGSYMSGILVVPRKKQTQFLVNEELLPVEYTVVSLGTDSVDTSKTESTLTILLRKK